MNKVFLRYFLFLLMTIMSFAYGSEKKVYGLHERVYLSDFDVRVHAKLDTGARTSSLGATNIQIFQKMGKEWVRFTPQIKGQQLAPVEKLLVRHSKIKRRVDDIKKGQAELTVRPVVLINICFDGHLREIEVNLTDRSKFVYPLLLGSITLSQLNALIDPSLIYQSKIANCK